MLMDSWVHVNDLVFLSLARSYSFVSNLFSNITITKNGKPFKNNIIDP